MSETQPMTDDDVKKAAAMMVRPLESRLFLSMPFGPLGRIQIVLPEQPDDEMFETEFQETLEYVERIMSRRRAWRKQRLAEELARIDPNLSIASPQGEG